MNKALEGYYYLTLEWIDEADEVPLQWEEVAVQTAKIVQCTEENRDQIRKEFSGAIGTVGEWYTHIESNHWRAAKTKEDLIVRMAGSK